MSKLPTFGLNKVSSTCDNIAGAAELQSLQLYLSSIKDTIDFIKDNKITKADMKTVHDLQSSISDL